MAAQTKTATASTHGAALVRGSHQLRIRGHGTRKAIKSKGFKAGGHPWAVSCVFHDRGLSSVSLELLHTHGAADVVAMATLWIEHPGGGSWRTAVWRSDDAHVFPAWPSLSASAMATSRSWELSLPYEYRWSKSHFVDDNGCFYIYCAVDVLQEDSDRIPDQISTVPSPTISEDLGRLLIYHQVGKGEGEPEAVVQSCWRRSMLPDVTFVVEQTEIQGHRLILSMRSPVFAAEFRWHTTESTLHVHDMSASTFRAMLQFVYTDELPPALTTAGGGRVAMVLDLLVAADRYDIQSLRLVCENILYESIDAASVMPTLMVVHCRRTFHSLEAFCIQYTASNPDVYAAVKATEEYKELKECCCYFILEITDKVANVSMDNTPGPDAPSSSRSLQPQMNPSTHYSSEVVEGTHQFNIPHFIYVQRRHGVGKEISSNTFQVGGYDWKVKVYPSSSSEQAEGHVSVYVELLTDSGTARVKSTVCIKLGDPNSEWPRSTKWLEKTFTTKSDWGYAKFITMESAKSRLADDGSLTIHCDLSITPKVCASTCTTTDGARAMMSPSSDMISHLERLLVGEQGSDMRFLVEESELQAHSLLIAARSQILYEAVAVVSKDNQIILVNDTTIAVFKAILHFIYTDELPPIKDLAHGVVEDEVVIAEDLLVAACWFRLDRMKAMCENLLATLVTEGNALSTLELAHDLRCSNLEDYCDKFIGLTKLARLGCCTNHRLLNMFGIY